MAIGFICFYCFDLLFLSAGNTSMLLSHVLHRKIKSSGIDGWGIQTIVIILVIAMVVLSVV